MFKFFLGVIIGIIISTIGVAGLAKWLDKGVDSVKVQSKELSK